MSIWKGCVFFDGNRVLHILNEDCSVIWIFNIFSLVLKFWEMSISFNIISSDFLSISNGSNPRPVYIAVL